MAQEIIGAARERGRGPFVILCVNRLGAQRAVQNLDITLGAFRRDMRGQPLCDDGPQILNWRFAVQDRADFGLQRPAA